MRKINFKKLVVTILFLSLGWYCIPRVVGYVGGILEATLVDMPQEYAKMPTDWLLKKMDSFNWRRAHVAYGVLVDRKEKRAVPKIIKKMQQDKNNEAMYIQALAKIGDEVAIPVIVNIMNSQAEQVPNNDIYWESIVALSKFNYEPIWPTVIKLAESNNAGDMRLAVDSMKNFRRKIAIPYLSKIKTKLENDDFEPFIREKNGIKTRVYVISLKDVNEAIKYLEENKAVKQ